MSVVVNLMDQVVQVNILDADTKQIIGENFLFNFQGGHYSHEYNMIRGGSSPYTFKAASTNSSPFEFRFVENQITALGYDYNSITGNVINVVYDEKSGLDIFPWVVNIYMSKL